MAALADPLPLDLLRKLPEPRRRKFLEKLTPAQLVDLRYGWRGIRARPEQLPPEGRWATWVMCAGRGSGKTRSMAEWVHERAMSGRFALGALVAPTPADARDFCVEGPSGLLNVGHPQDRPTYIGARRVVEWKTGFRMLIYSAEDPDQIRGPNVDTGWCSELGSWPVAQGRAAGESKAQQSWDNLMFTLRVGPDPRCVVDTTPRPMEPLRSLLKAPDTAITRGTTFDNRANLAPQFFERLAKYEGTRLGRQELLGELLEDVEGALWTLELIERHRRPVPEAMSRVVVGIDPMGGGGAECGIVVAGEVRGKQPHYHVIADYSTRGTPHEWASAAIRAFDEHAADLVVAEANYGGAMVEGTLRNIRPRLPVKVVHASRGKAVRAEPISTMYDMGLVHHSPVNGNGERDEHGRPATLGELEDQMTTWVPGMPSPDRLDALVWALTELSTGRPAQVSLVRATVGDPGPRRGVTDRLVG